MGESPPLTTTRHTSSPRCSFPFDEEHHGSVELNRKRKLLQYELDNSGLPLQQHKLRDRFSSSDQGSLVLKSWEKESSHQELIGREISDRLEQQETYGNYSNFAFQSYDNRMVIDVEAKTEEVSAKPYQVQPSTSYQSSTSHISKGTGSRTTEELISGLHEELGDTLQSEPECKVSEPKFESDSDNSMSESGDIAAVDEDAEADEIMLYSNDVTADALLLSAGRWSVGQDARLGTRKPTIDQEFEQYFSTLML